METKQVFRSTTGIQAYGQALTSLQLTHLLRRTLFGISQKDLNYLSGKNLDEILGLLLLPGSVPNPPINTYNDTNFTDPTVPA
ncbi:MAG: hypothetical protein O2951_14740, partial [Bacteroidetes bacterium]|nr:hypothetical protein [Bacteroidota bacterium]